MENENKLLKSFHNIIDFFTRDTTTIGVRMSGKTNLMREKKEKQENDIAIVERSLNALIVIFDKQVDSIIFFDCDTYEEYVDKQKEYYKKNVCKGTFSTYKEWASHWLLTEQEFADLMKVYLDYEE